MGLTPSLVSVLVGHLDNLLPYKTGRSLEQLAEDRSVRSVLESLFKICQSRIDHVIRGLLQLHSTVNSSTTTDERKSVHYVYSQLIVLRAIALTLILHWGNIHHPDAQSHHEPTKEAPLNESELQTLHHSNVAQKYVDETMTRLDCMYPTKMDETIAESLLYTISQYLRDWRPTDEIDLTCTTINHVFAKLYAAKRTDNTLSETMFKCLTDAFEGRATPQFFAWYCLAIPTTDPYMETQEAAGVAFHYLSASNWSQCFSKVRQSIATLGNNNITASGIADIRLMCFACPDTQKIGQLIDICAEYFGKLQYNEQVILVQSLRKAVWNFLIRYPKSYIDCYKNNKRVASKHVDKLLTTLRSMDGVAKGGRAFPGKPLKFLLFAICPDIVAQIVSDLESGGKSKCPYTVYIQNLLRALQSSTVPDLALVSALGLCSASVAQFVDKTQSIVRLVKTLEGPLFRIIYDTNHQVNRFSGGVDVGSLLPIIFKIATFMGPDRMANEYAPILLKESVQFSFRLAFIQGITEVFTNPTMVRFHDISILGDNVSKNIMYLFQECVATLRKAGDKKPQPARRGSLAIDRRPHRRTLNTSDQVPSTPFIDSNSGTHSGMSSGSSMDLSQFSDDRANKFAMVKAILSLYIARPEIALGVGDRTARYADFQITATVITACLQFESNSVRRLAGTALLELWEPSIIDMWANSEETMEGFWTLGCQMMNVVCKLIINTPHNLYPEHSVWYMQLLRGLLDRRVRYLKYRQEIAYVGYRTTENDKYRATYEVMCFCTIWSLRSTVVEILLETMRKAYETFRLSIDPDYEGEPDTLADVLNLELLLEIVKDNTKSSGTYGRVAQQKAIWKLVRQYVRPTAPAQIATQQCFCQWKLMLQRLIQATEARNRQSEAGEKDLRSGVASDGGSVVTSAHSVSAIASVNQAVTSRKKPGFYEKLTKSSKLSSITNNFTSHHRDNPNRKSTSNTIMTSTTSTLSTYESNYDFLKLSWKNCTGFLLSISSVCLVDAKKLPNFVINIDSKRDGISEASGLADAELGSIVDVFLRELLDLLICDDLYMRESVREMLSNETHSDIAPNLIAQAHNVLCGFILPSGELLCDDRHTLYVGQITNVIKTLLERGDSWPEHAFKVDMGPFILKLSRYLQEVHKTHPLAALREKLLFAQLVTALMSKSVKLSMFNEVNTRNSLLDCFVNWVNDLQRLIDAQSAVHPENINLLRNTILACMKAIVALLDNLPIQPVDGSAQISSGTGNLAQDMRPYRSKLFKRYSEFFISLITHLRNTSETMTMSQSANSGSATSQSQSIPSTQNSNQGVGQQQGQQQPQSQQQRLQRSESVTGVNVPNPPLSPVTPQYTSGNKSVGNIPRPRVMLSSHASNMIEACVKALHNLLSSNIEVGLQYSLDYAYSDEIKLRVIFSSIITNIMNQGLELDCLDEVSVSVWQRRLVDQLVDHDEWLLAINEVCQVQDIEELSPVLLAIFEARGQGLHLLKTIITCELQKTDSAAELFRRNCLATRLLSSYSKLHGAPYLESTLKSQILKLLRDKPERVTFELNPNRLPPHHSTKQNLVNLQQLCRNILDGITESSALMPASFKRVCNMLYTLVEPHFPGSGLTAVGGFLFLRFFCPVMVAPDTHKLVPPIESREIRRGLMLCTKVIQNIANDVLFGSKEEYMIALNDLVSEYRPKVQKFLEETIQIPDDIPEQDSALTSKESKSSISSSRLSISVHDSAEMNGKGHTSSMSDKDFSQPPDVDIESFYVLQRFLYDNQTRLKQYIALQSGPSNIVPGNESDSSSLFSIKKHDLMAKPGHNPQTQKIFDQLFYIMQQLGPPPTNPAKDASNLAKAAEASNSLFYDVLKRDAHKSTEAIVKKKIFYVGGPSRDKRPILYIIARRLQAQAIDMDMVMLHLLRLLEPFTRTPFEIFFDLTQFGVANEISSQWLKQLQIILPSSISSNLEQVYWYNVNTYFRKFVKSDFITLPPRMIKRSVLPETLSSLREHIANPEADLPQGTVSLEKDIGVTVTPVTRLNRQQNPMPCIIKITPDAIQITSLKKQEVFGLNIFFNDVFHITEVSDIQLSSISKITENSPAYSDVSTMYSSKFAKSGKQHSKYKGSRSSGEELENTLVSIRFEGISMSVLFSSPKAELIYKAVRSARAQYEIPIMPPTPERIIRPSDVPGTLLNMALLNCGSEDSSLRMSSFLMLQSLMMTFNKSASSTVMLTPELCPPPNSIDFISSISATISRTSPELTLELLSEALKQFTKFNPFLRQWALHYLQPWIPNLNMFYRYSPTNPEASRKTRDIIRELICINIQKPALYHHFKSLIWTKVAAVEGLVDLVIGLFVSMGVECGPLSIQTEMLGDLYAFLTSVNPRYNKIPIRLRKLLSLTSTSPVRDLCDHSSWTEIQIILRFLLMASFENPGLAKAYFHEIAHITCMLLGTGPMYTRITLQGIVIHCLRSLISELKPNAMVGPGILDSGDPIYQLQNMLIELSDNHFKYQFGLKQRPISTESFVVNALGKTSTTTIANAFLMAGSPFHFDESPATVLVNQGITCAVEDVAQFFLDVMSSPVFSPEIGDSWRSRWAGLVSSTTFLYNPALQPRAFATLGQLSRKDEVDDDLLYQTLATLRGALLAFKTDEDDLAVAVVHCLTKLVDHMPEDSSYLVSLFWLAISIVLIGHTRLFSAGTGLLSHVITALDNCGAFNPQNGGGFSSFLITARDPVLDVLTELESVVGINFQASFSVALSTALARGLSDSLTADGTYNVLKLILSIASRSRQKQVSDWNHDYLDDIVPYMILALPVAATRKEISVIVMPPTLNIDMEDGQKVAKNSGYLPLLETIFKNDEDRVTDSYSMLCGVLISGLIYQLKADQALTVLCTTFKSRLVLSDHDSARDLVKAIIPCINEVLRTRTTGTLLQSVYNIIFASVEERLPVPSAGKHDEASTVPLGSSISNDRISKVSPAAHGSPSPTGGLNLSGRAMAIKNTTTNVTPPSIAATKSDRLAPAQVNRSTTVPSITGAVGPLNQKHHPLSNPPFSSMNAVLNSGTNGFSEYLSEYLTTGLTMAGFPGLPNAFSFDVEANMQVQIAELAASLIDRIL
ncbi:Ras GTPase activating protein ira2 [Mycoemilia scoparia]|uniref:Ras GTPase activating protein ira2 n=1 Tax=Mycoemilia scoparia TaxID=417184 RepID=A0A9W8DQQ0_9FUNG|nr:Ras GTPase activating protein ira2 [Mycoemilia scoparia]